MSMTISALRSSSLRCWFSRRSFWSSSPRALRLDLGPRFCGVRACRHFERHLQNRPRLELAKRLIADTCEKQNIPPGQSTLHADRGSSMESKAVAFLLADLAVTKSHSRPYVSDDNPYSESHFRTLKYRPDFPDRFGCIQDSRAFCQSFFAWYNEEHRHSGIEILTPSMVHYGQAGAVIGRRQVVLDAAYEAHRERFVRAAPKSLGVPQEVWINKPSENKTP